MFCGYIGQHIIGSFYRIMLYVITLCGLGQRFKNANYTTPKPFLKVHGKAIIDHVIDSLGPTDDCKILIILPAYFKYHPQYHVLQADPRIQIATLYNPTQGAVDTALQGILQSAAHYSMEEPVAFVDGDTYYKVPLSQIPLNGKNAITVFNEPDESMTGYSFCRLAGEDQRILEIVEKKRISPWAVSGCYSFESIGLFVKYARMCIADPVNKQKGEYYMSSVYRILLDYREPLKAIIVAKEDVVCLGTPEQAIMALPKVFVSRRFCFDLDGTLVTFPKVKGDYETVEPITHNIKYLRYLKSMGHTIIIHTARRMRTHKGNVGSVIKDIGMITLQTLQNMNIPYDELVFGKPDADFYVDDKAISYSNSWEKETGFYNLDGFLEPRSFNTIEVNAQKGTIVKRGKIAKIKAEIHYYLNIPEVVEHMFPMMVTYYEDSYEMTILNGPTYSTLYVNELLQPEHLDKLLDALAMLHRADDSRKCDITTRDINAFYVKKLRERIPPDSALAARLDRDIREVVAWLHNESAPSLAVIHGDPVFTNVIYDAGNVRFIDMMGLIGDKETIWGDALYDYAKVYQSLMGYDEVLQDKYVQFGYKSTMLARFESRFDKETLGKIKMLAKYLVLCLLPLHESRVAETMIRVAFSG
jgi:capsule biosynthesis phosphatase